MAQNKTVSIAVIGGGVVLIYLGYTGYLGNVWNAIKGQQVGGTPSSEPAAKSPGATVNPLPTGALPTSFPGWSTIPGGTYGTVRNPAPTSPSYADLRDGLIRRAQGGQVDVPQPTGHMVSAENARGGEVSSNPTIPGVFYVVPSGAGGITVSRYPGT